MLRCVVHIFRTFILIYSYTCVRRRKSQQKFGSINFKCKQALMHGITRILWFTSMLSLLQYLLVSTNLRQILDAARHAVSQVYHLRPNRRHRLMHFVSHQCRSHKISKTFPYILSRLKRPPPISAIMTISKYSTSLEVFHHPPFS